MNCEIAKSCYYDYLANPETVASEMKAHVEQCAVCREEIDRLRDILAQTEPTEKPSRPHCLQLHYQLLDRWVSCEQAACFLPSLLMPQLHLRQQTPVTAHVDHCPDCQTALKEIQSLQLTSSELITAARYLSGEQQTDALKPFTYAVLDKIRQRCGSPVLTRMQLSAADDATWLTDTAVVEVKRRTVTRRRTVSVWITSGVAAAILLAVLLVLPASDVQALDVSQLYMTLDKVRNVHIQKYEDTQQLENIWIADGLGAYLFQQDSRTVFVDRHTGNIFQQHQGAVQLVSQGGETDLEHPWGLLPFKQISELPASYDWDHVADTVLDSGVEVQVYEWSWVESLAPNKRMKRIWRGYLDRRSHLPYRIEWLDQIGESPAQLIMEMKIQYPTDAECRAVFERYGFGGLLGYGVQRDKLDAFPSVSNVGSTDSALFLSTWPSAKTALTLPEE
jgi:hypothetical protein